MTNESRKRASRWRTARSSIRTAIALATGLVAVLALTASADVPEPIVPVPRDAFIPVTLVQLTPAPTVRPRIGPTADFPRASASFATPPPPAAPRAATTPKATPKPKPKPAPALPAGHYSPTVTQARAYARARIGATQFACLDRLFTRESHWRTRALNHSSGAYGIPQALPGRKMARAGADWRTNPVTQVKWGLGYIKARYGTACGAWAHSQRTGWY